MPGRKRDTAKSPDLEQQRGDTRYREQARQLSQSLPSPPETDPGGPALGGGEPRPFSETDRDERSDTPRRVGEIPRGTGAAPEQAEFDEDGGGPRQGVQPTEGGPAPREMVARDDEALRAETGGMGGLDRSAEETRPGAMTEGTPAGARTRDAAGRRTQSPGSRAAAPGRSGPGAVKGRNQTTTGRGGKKGRGTSGTKNKSAGRKGGKSTGRGR